MRIYNFEFNRRELSGAMGDLGTLIPLSIALVIINGLGFTPVFLMVGLLYLFCGLYYKLPIPVQPLKLVTATAIVLPEIVTPQVMSATAILFGAFLLLLAFTGLINQITKIFTKPVIRGMQLGLGLILIIKGIDLIQKKELFILQGGEDLMGNVPINLIIGIIGSVLVLFLLTSKRFPAAMIIVGMGVIIGIAFGALSDIQWIFGPTSMELLWPGPSDYVTALFLMVIPQIPLTIGNSIVGATDTVRSLYGTTGRVTHRSLATDMGVANIATGFLAGMPMCHGAGGVVAHYLFGARTGGSIIMIGSFFVIISLAFGMVGVSILSTIPNAVLGILLMFAGIELAILVKDVTEKKDLFITLLIAGIALATKNMSIAFGAGIVAAYLIRWRKLEI